MGFVSTTYRIIELLLSNPRTKIINVIVKLRQNILTAYIFPRWTRIPENYIKHFGNPDKTIKPGSSEMAGLIITVDKEVYDFSTEENVWKALDYVSTPEKDLYFVYEDIQRKAKDSLEEFNFSYPELEEKLDALWKKGIEVGFVKEECMEGIQKKTYQNGLIEVQFNPHRKSIVSSSRVEKRSRGEEACPYCIQEEGREDLPWNGFIISANPYPYYDHHLVIVHPQHVYQYIDKKGVKIMADFVLNAPRYFAVYNGPPGTSILSHMHFQAGIYQLPVERAKKEVLKEDGHLKVSKVNDFPTRALVVEKFMPGIESS